MDAVILVGGEGTRLRPLTYGTPKAMVPILGRPFLEHMLVYLRRQGLQRVFLALGHQPDAIQAHFGDGSRLDLELQMRVEAQPLGSAGAIHQFRDRLSSPFFAFNGDILTDMALGPMIEQHRRVNAQISIGLMEVDDPAGFGVVALDARDRILRFVEKPPRELAPSRWANAGVWLFQREPLARIPRDRKSMVETELFPDLIAAGGHVQGYTQRCFWVDIGTPERYLGVQLRMLAEPELRILPLTTWPGTPYLCADQVPDSPPPSVAPDAVLTGPVLLGAGVELAAGARIVGPSAIGAGTRIGSGAEVRESVLWQHCDVAEGAQVRRTVLADGVRVGAHALLSGATAGHHAIIAAGARIEGQRIDPRTGASV